MTTYDFSKATPAMIKKVRAVINEHGLSYDMVKSKSSAASDIMQWVLDWIDAAEASGELNNLESEMKDINLAIQVFDTEKKEWESYL